MKELRILIKLHHCQTHKDMSTLFSQEKIWRNKQRYYHYAKQLFSIEQLYELLSDCFHIDLVIKGHAKGEALFELRQITARFLAKDG
jgi:DNA polymerase III delta subunit